MKTVHHIGGTARLHIEPLPECKHISVAHHDGNLIDIFFVTPRSGLSIGERLMTLGADGLPPAEAEKALREAAARLIALADSIGRAAMTPEDARAEAAARG